MTKYSEIVSFENLDTVLIDGVCVCERRRAHDRRRTRKKHQGFERRVSSQRRQNRQIDHYV